LIKKRTSAHTRQTVNEYQTEATFAGFVDDASGAIELGSPANEGKFAFGFATILRIGELSSNRWYRLTPVVE